MATAGSHTPQPSSNSYGSNGSLGPVKNRRPRTKSDYEEGLDSLLSEPSGWGELPSPKPSDLDNGTEPWGVPPDDLDRQQRREKTKTRHPSTSSPAVHVAASDMGK